MAELIRFLTCGSVDDGKSTMIGKLLFDAGLIYEDHLQSLRAEMKANGNQSGEIDYSFLLDGLLAERQQGITIDVAYRYFSLKDRKFIVADTPGHTQYTKNMATGASHCEAAVILIDARKGLGVQTRRHSLICAMMGIRKVIFAINKFDLVDWSQEVYTTIAGDCTNLVNELAAIGYGNLKYGCIPVCALLGDNLLHRSENMPWYKGPTVYEWLESLRHEEQPSSGSAEFTVQNVLKSSSRDSNNNFQAHSQFTNGELKNFRAYAGKLASGTLSSGQTVKVLPSGLKTSVKGVIKGFGFVQSASAGDSVSLMLEDEIDISRGDIIVTDDVPVSSHSDFIAEVIWMDDKPLYNRDNYIIKGYFGYINATFTKVVHKYNLETYRHIATDRLELNEAGTVHVNCHRPLFLQEYKDNRHTGSFLIIDRLSNRTVGGGMIRELVDTKTAPEPALSRKKPFILWFTGLSGSGKTTVSEYLRNTLLLKGVSSVLLDGDTLRHGVSKGLGFTDEDRKENIRRTAEMAKLIADSGVNAICALISPFESDRQQARKLLEGYRFVEIFVDTPLEVCEERDAKGFYKKARIREILDFTGIGSIYEKPANPDVTINTDSIPTGESVDRIIDYLLINGIL